MNKKNMLIEDRAISLQAAARAYFRSAADIIYQDPHQWSTRPCTTCKTITSLTGEPFGCDRYRVEKGQ